MVVKLPELTVRVKHEFACAARDFVLTIEELLITRERPPPGVRGRCGDVEGVFTVGGLVIPGCELILMLLIILLLLEEVLSPEGSLLVVVEDDALKGEG